MSQSITAPDMSQPPIKAAQIRPWIITSDINDECESGRESNFEITLPAQPTHSEVINNASNVSKSF